MAVKVRTATFTGTDASTQDFTISGLGASTEFVCAIIMWSRWNTSGVGATPDGCIGVGFTDGTNDRCAFTFQEDGNTSDQGRRDNNNDVCINVQSISGGSPSRSGAGSFNSWITDGMRLDWDDQLGADAGNIKITVIFFLDDAATKKLKAIAGDVDLTTLPPVTQTVTTTGVNPTLVFAASSCVPTGAYTDTTHTNGALSFGVAVDDGGGAPLPQDAYRYGSAYGASAGQAFALLPPQDANVWLAANIFNGTTYARWQCSSMGSGSFVLTPLQSGAMQLCYLAIDLGSDILPQVVTTNLPTTTADETINFGDLTAAPQFVMGVMTRMGIRGTIRQDSEAGSFSLYCADDTREVTHAFTNDDNAATIQSVSYFDDTAAALPLDQAGDSDTSAEFDMAFSAFSATGPDVTFTSVNPTTGTRIAWWLAIEEDVAAPADTVHPTYARRYEHSAAPNPSLRM